MKFARVFQTHHMLYFTHFPHEAHLLFVISVHMLNTHIYSMWFYFQLDFFHDSFISTCIFFTYRAYAFNFPYLVIFFFFVHVFFFYMPYLLLSLLLLHFYFFMVITYNSHDIHFLEITPGISAYTV